MDEIQVETQVKYTGGDTDTVESRNTDKVSRNTDIIQKGLVVGLM